MTILNMPDRLEMTLVAVAMNWDTADGFLNKNKMFESAVESAEMKRTTKKRKMSQYKTPEHLILYLSYQ